MKKILIVDDDLLMRELLAEVIEKDLPGQYECHFATDGLDALQVISEMSGPLFSLITDFNMPIMSGGQLVREVLRRGIAIAKILIISGDENNKLLLLDVLPENEHISFAVKTQVVDDLGQRFL